jgi:hypothetical protein
VLPAAYRPAANVYVPVDMCDVTSGRLLIEPSGDVIIEEQDGALDNADCFTSLDGVSFVQTAAVTALTPINGWGPTDYGTASPAVALVNGVVHFQGAISASSPPTSTAFTLPSDMTPSVAIYVPVDMCDSTNGRLDIGTDGSVSLEEEDGSTTNENCFTSLDGASFILTPKDSTLLKLKNGWTSEPFGTGPASVELSKGIVRFAGAISGGRSADVLFKLPSTMKPSKDVYIQVDLCDTTNGRLEILPSGKVTVQGEDDGTDANCFTSLDGASFVQ